MSNPVTNADIEDVLSSIRRLVSEESRPQVAPPPVAVADRLVLTPALRVMETEQPEEMTSGQPADQDIEDIPAETDELPQPELVEAYEVAGVPRDETGRRNLEARIAELEAVISDHGGQWEQDGEEGGANAGGAVRGLDWLDAPTAEPDEAPFAEDAEAEAPETAQVIDGTWDDSRAEAGETAFLDAEQADIEENFSADDYEPAGLSDAEFGAEPAVIPDPEDALMRDFLVDEEILRNLVSEIVRQELQGPLGERITRNVRKLVRREIMRALASQDLE